MPIRRRIRRDTRLRTTPAVRPTNPRTTHVRADSFQTRIKDFDTLQNTLPVLMLPVRMETRFLPANSPTHLKVRIFPDQIFLDDHARQLTKDEYELGRKFWNDLEPYTGKDDYEDHRKQAWLWLTGVLGTARASYVAEQAKQKIPASKLRVNDNSVITKSNLLPDYWFVVGYNSKGERVLESVSSAIDPDLHFSPDIEYSETIINDLSIDPDLKWMMDFKSAKNKGMALEVRLNNTTKEGFDALYVVGIKTKEKDKKLTPKKAATYLNDVLSGHYYTEGAGFAPQGIPTNNTDEVTTGWSAFAADQEGVWHRSIEKDNKKTTTPPQDDELACAGAFIPTNNITVKEDLKNYSILEQALGLSDNSILKSFEYREGFEKEAMQSMNTALWGVTLGEYVRSLLANKASVPLTEKEISWLQDWTQDHVMGGAHLPALRIGEVPYGILPIQATKHMNPKLVEEKKLFDLLEKLNEYWTKHKSSAKQLTQFQQGTTGVGDRLLDLLSRQPHPVKFSAQQLSNDRGLILFWYALIKAALFDKEHSVLTEVLQKYTTADLDEFYTKTYSSAGMEKSTYVLLKAQIEAESKNVRNKDEKDTIDQGIKILEMMIEVMDDHYLRGKELNKFQTDIVDSNMSNDVDDPQMIYSRYKNEEENLLQSRLIEVKTEDDIGVAASEYLSYLQKYAKSLINSNTQAGQSPLHGKDKPLLYQLIYTAIGRISADTPKSSMTLSLTSRTSASAQLKKVRNLRNYRLNETVSALTLLQKLPADQLELLMQQTLGLFGWRLDAWYASLHHKRLQDLRSSKAEGLQIGAFGWVENLKPRSKTVTGTDISEGFIHTPSLNHAKTAAVLRAGYQAYREEGLNTPFAVDLSSSRMRKASWMFDAVRQGQDLGDVLGYAFERILHENRKDHWIYPVRQAVLAFTKEKMDPKFPTVDGLALYDLWTWNGDQKEFMRLVTSAEYGKSLKQKEIETDMRELEDLRDLLGDAAIADSVHALVQGNTDRAGATLSAVGYGDVPPPELNVLQTQRKGMTLRHKVLMMVPANQKAPSTWITHKESVHGGLRAAFYPDGEHLLSAIIGATKNITFDVGYFLPDGSLVKTFTLSLAQMAQKDPRFALGALDVLAMLPLDNDTRDSTLSGWISLYLDSHKPKNTSVEAYGGIVWGENAENTINSILLLSGWRDVLGKSRSIKAEDFLFDSENEDEGETKLPEQYIAQLQNTLDELRLFYKDVSRISQMYFTDHILAIGNPGQEIDTLTNLLLTAAKFLLVDNIPSMPEDLTGCETIMPTLQAITDKTEHRIERIDTLLGDDKDLSGLSTKDVKALAKLIIGKSSTHFDQVFLTQGQTTTLSRSLSLSGTCFENGPVDGYVWLEKMQYVRPDLKVFSEALLVQDSSGFTDGGGQFSVAQFPRIDGEKWTALTPPVEKEDTGHGHRQSFLTLLPSKVSADDFRKGGFVGLFVDEIVERLPGTEEDTGVALHFDAPNSEPPQVMLLAMAPERKKWSFDLMIDTLQESLEQAKRRGLDGEDITELDQYLPGIFAAKNLTLGKKDG